MTRALTISPIRILLFLCYVISSVVAETYYDLLEVPMQMDKSGIKKAWRKLSMKYHPDKNPGDELAAEFYKKINRAYEVLSNDDKRQIYDHGGEDALERFE